MGRRGGLVNRAGDRLRPARSRETQTAHQRLGIAYANRDRRCSARQRRVSEQRNRCTASHLTPDRANPPHPRLHQTWTELAGTTRPGNSTPHLSCAQCDLVHSATISSKIRFVSGRLELRIASSYEGSSTTSTTWWVLRSLATIECVAVRATTAACMACTRHHSRRVEI